MLIFCPKIVLICKCKQKKKYVVISNEGNQARITYTSSKVITSVLQKCTRIFGGKVSVLNIISLEY